MNKNFTPNANGALQEKLMQLLKKTQVVRAKHNNTNNPLVNGVDGVDFINVDDKAKTALGVLLSPNNNYHFSNTRMGGFMSICGVYWYLINPDHPEVIRKMGDATIRNSSKDVKVHYPENLEAILLFSIYNRVSQMKVLKEALIQNELPLAMFYVDSNTGRRKQSNFGKMILPLIQEVSACLKEKRKPDYVRFMDHPEADMWASVASIMPPKPISKPKPVPVVTQMEEVNEDIDQTTVLTTSGLPDWKALEEQVEQEESALIDNIDVVVAEVIPG